MRIAVLNRTEYECSKLLWMDCFPEDSKEFVDLYYRERSRPEYVLGAFLCEKDEKPVSMLHMIPMRIRCGEGSINVCFVAGVCTDPAYRGRGICSRLFAEAFDIMRERGFDASVLQPFETSFYERFGYKSFIRRNRIRLSADRTIDFGRPYERVQDEFDAEILTELYNTFLEGKNGWSIRDEDYFKHFLNEYSLSEARLVISEKGCCAGYAVNEDEFAANELFFVPGTDPVSLLPKGFKEYSFPLPFEIPVPDGCSFNTEDFSMIKTLGASLGICFGSTYGFDMY